MEEVKEILLEKLVNNEPFLVKEILTYLPKCFVCNKHKLKLHKSYCYTHIYPQIYMEICEECIKNFKFEKCRQCNIYTDKNRCYTFYFGGIVCRYCSQGVLLTDV